MKPRIQYIMTNIEYKFWTNKIFINIIMKDIKANITLFFTNKICINIIMKYMKTNITLLYTNKICINIKMKYMKANITLLSSYVLEHLGKDILII